MQCYSGAIIRLEAAYIIAWPARVKPPAVECYRRQTTKVALEQNNTGPYTMCRRASNNVSSGRAQINTVETPLHTYTAYTKWSVVLFWLSVSARRREAAVLCVDSVVGWWLGFSVVDYERHVADTFLPLVDAARHVIITVGYVVVIVLTAMFAFHVAGWTICRCLRLRVVVPARGAAVRRPGRLQMSADSSVQTFIRHRRVDVDFCIDDDDDDDASDYDDADSSRFDSIRRRSAATSASVAHARRYDSTSAAAPACSPSAVEFKYSETNV